ncbi:MAG: glycoside hydrolase family 13 protein [Clostridiales bacterium]|nr:glycoside hydrolase family 13 protein [Clostridiales bacterium]
MNVHALLHIPESSYCDCIDEHTVQITLRTSAHDPFDSVTLVYGGKYEYYKRQSRVAMRKRFTDGTFDYYTVRLSLADVRLLYIFELVQNGARVFFSEAGVSETYDFALSAYSSFQLAYINRADLLPAVDWMQRAVFYEIFVDRFYRGDAKKSDAYIDLRWGDIPNAKSFAGGDLQGIDEKLGYLADLGVTAVYLTPVFRSVSNHKYDTADYYEIDPQFGDKQALRRLVENAHARGMKIVLDAVFNHCSEHLAQFRDVAARGKDSPYFDWFLIRGDKPNAKEGNYECFGSCRYMPKLNTSNPQVQKFLADVGTYWIRECDIDGWRLDVSDEVSHDFWRYFRKAVKEVKPDCVLIGENWHDSTPFLRGDQFDGVMNYALTKACMDYFASGELDAQGFAHRLSGLYVRQTRAVNSMMLNLLDSHDTHRFYSLVHKNPDKLLCALAVLFMHTGAPCLLYGTEVCTEGGYDPDCRRTMDWSERNPRDIRSAIAALAALRRREETACGEISFAADGGLFIMEREGDAVLRLTVNNTDSSLPYVARGQTLTEHNRAGNVLHAAGFVIERYEP